MAGGFTQARQQAILDAELVAGDYIAFSTNGTSETANVPRMAIVAWSAASAATPSVKSNSGALVSPAATGAAVVTHGAVFSASTAGTQKSDWQALAASKTLGIGDTLQFPIGTVTFSLD